MVFPIITIIVTIIIFLLSSLPLHFAVKLWGGETNLLKTALVALIAGIIVSIIQLFFSVWGGLIAFIILLFIYRTMFDVGWIRSFLVWLMQLVFIVVFLVLARLIGVTIAVW